MMSVLQAAAEQAADAAAAASQDTDGFHDPGLLLYMLPYIVMGASIVLAMNYCKHDKTVLPLKLLGDRIVYWYSPKAAGTDGSSSSTSEAAVAAAVAALSSPAQGGNKKKVRKLQQQQQQQMGAAQGTTGLLQGGYLGSELLGLLEFTEDLDYLIRVVGSMAVNVGAAVGIRYFFNPAFPVQSLNFYSVGLVFVLHILYKVEWRHISVTKEEKVYMAVAAVVGGIVAISLTVWARRSTLAFDTAAACWEITSRIAGFTKVRFKKLPEDALVPFREAGPVGAGLSLVAALIAGLLLAPGMRYGRLLQDFLEPPIWAASLKPQLKQKLLLQTAFALQLLQTPLWVTSMTDVLRLPAGSLPVLRGVVMLLVALLQVAAVPSLLQGFLYRTPLHAHVVARHPGASEENRGKSVRHVTNVTLSCVAQVCIQLLVVPSIMLLSSLAYLMMCFAPPSAAQHPNVSVWDKQPSAMVMCVAGFIGWWSSSVYMAWGSLGAVVARMQTAAVQ